MRVALLKATLAILFTGCGVGAAGVWLLPVEVVQNWAYLHAPQDPYAQFETVGQAEALWWLGRITLPVLAVAFVAAMLNLDDVAETLRRAGGELRDLIRAAAVTARSRRRRIVIGSTVISGLIFAWLVLAGIHCVWAVRQRTREWPYYRLHSGREVLPNISDSNRDVIRYLWEATPEDARILVLSDQKVFFLSYYLLPRRLFHPTHADAEFSVPKPGETGQFAAYQLADLSSGAIRDIHPDFILQYFEGERYNRSERRDDDVRWVAFWRRRNRSADVPPYVVVLRPYVPEGAP